MSVLLRGMTWDDPRGWGPMEELGKAFALTPTGRDVTVEWDIQPLEGFESRSILELSQHYDLLNLDHPHLGEATASGALHPLGSITDTFIGHSLASYHLDGQLWAIPVDGACQVAAYHPDRVTDFPESFDQVLELARAQPVASSLTGLHSLMALLTILAQNGTPLSDSPRTPWPRPDAFDPAARLLSKLTQACLPESLDWNPLEMLTAMGQGRCDYAPFTFAYVNFQKDGVRFAAVPGTAGAVLGGTGLAVSSRSKHPELAREFARFTGSTQIQKTLWPDHGGQPADREAWDHLADHDPFYRDLRATLESAWIRPRYHGWIHRQTEAGRLINRWLRQTDPHPKQLLDELNALWLST